MPDNLFLYFFIAIILFHAIPGLFFLNHEKKLISIYKQEDSILLENISGTIITENGFLKKNYRWCKFDLMINKNSIFIFPRDLYFIPARVINLIFSYSDKENNPKRAELLRDFKIGRNTVELIYYPKILLARSQKIQLTNLTQEQISILENSFDGKIRRMR